MGRIKTKLIKRITKEVIQKNEGEFTSNYAKNQKIVERYLDVSSKKLRNVIAGYATRIIRREEK